MYLSVQQLESAAGGVERALDQLRIAQAHVGQWRSVNADAYRAMLESAVVQIHQLRSETEEQVWALKNLLAEFSW